MKMKEYMNNMPENIKTKKEIEVYFKDGMKKTVENNNVDKPKKEPNDYNKFVKEQIKILKKDDPNLTGPQVFSMVAAMWRKQKEDNVAKVNDVKVEDVKVEDVKVEDVKDDDVKVNDVKVGDVKDDDVKVDDVKVEDDDVKEVKGKKKKAK